jgi:hypothetical protein
MEIKHGRIQFIVEISGVGPHGSFYADHQIHMWEIGSSPPITNALQQFPVTWYVAGSGNLVEDNGVGTVRKAHWFRDHKKSVQETMQVWLSSNTIHVSASTSIPAHNAIDLYQQQFINGQPQTPGVTQLSATPMAWPAIQWNASYISFLEKLQQPQPQVSGPQQPGYAKIKGGIGLWNIVFSLS